MNILVFLGWREWLLLLLLVFNVSEHSGVFRMAGVVVISVNSLECPGCSL